MNTPGLRVQPIRTLDQGADVNEVFLDDVAGAGRRTCVGEENRGWTIAKYLLGHERTNIAGIGMCKRLLRRVKEHRRAEKPARAPADRGRSLPRAPRAAGDPGAVARMVADARDLARAGRARDRHRGVDAQDPRLRDPAGTRRELLMECAGPYALPYLPEALEDGLHGPRRPERHTARGLAGPVLRPAQGRDLRRHQRSAEEHHRSRRCWGSDDGLHTHRRTVDAGRRGRPLARVGLRLRTAPTHRLGRGRASDANWRQLADLGLLGLNVPEEDGGMGAHVGRGADRHAGVRSCARGRAVPADAHSLRRRCWRVPARSRSANRGCPSSSAARRGWSWRRTSRVRDSISTTSRRRPCARATVTCWTDASPSSWAARAPTVSSCPHGRRARRASPSGISLFVVPAASAGLGLDGKPTIDGQRAAEVTLSGVAGRRRRAARHVARRFRGARACHRPRHCGPVRGGGRRDGDSCSR